MDVMNPASYMRLPIPPVPRTQGLTSTTFKVPPLDGSLTFPNIWDWHYENSPEHPLLLYSDDDGHVTTIRIKEVIRAIHRAARHVRAVTSGRGARPVVGILAASDTVTAYAMLFGTIRASCVTFPISTRNSAGAVAHLIAKTNIDHLIVGRESSYQKLAHDAVQMLQDQGEKVPDLSTMPVFEDLYKNEEFFELLPPLDAKMSDLCFYLHSSGSTAYPKPIPYSYYQQLMLALVPYFGERDWAETRIAVHSLPMYHGMGIILAYASMTAGATLTTFKPQSPALIASPENMLKPIVDTKSHLLLCVPSFVEIWARDPESVRQLKTLEGLLYGGANLKKEAGDQLSAAGVPIFTMYGTTETGIINVLLPKKAFKDWEYFQFAANTRPHFLPHENGNAELVLAACPFSEVCYMNTVIDGVGAYATNDLLAPHPTEPGYWKIFGRADDQIMHSTGEKTNPGPLEKILREDPRVLSSVMFGRGRFNAGIIVDPKPEYKFDPADESKLIEFRNAIWPTVERMNEYAPQHSRLFKEMILVALPSKPFEYTAKNDPRRHALVKLYEPEINALYEAVDQTAQADLNPPQSWTYSTAKHFVAAVIERVLDQGLGENDDIFQNGCDSLQATWVRNSILRAIRETTKLNTRIIPGNFVYRNPTVAGLAAFILSLANSETPEESLDNDDAVASMLAMAEKYTQNFPRHVSTTPAPSKEIVLVTGTTGGLGASLLVALTQSPEVERIYAINRKGQGSIVDRQRAVLQERGFDDRAILSSPKLVLIDTNIDDDRFGMSSDVFDEIRTSITLVIHNAWPVNFNMSLSYFEPSLRTVRRLIDLTLGSPHQTPAKLLFISSIGTLQGADRSQAVKEAAVDPHIAAGMGYAEAKWVAERMLELAAEQTLLHTVSIRLGQITGTTAGAWKTTEWLPALVKSSVYMGYLPALPQNVSWIPVDVAAKAVFEMRNSDVNYLHLAHPRPVPWSSVIGPIGVELGLETIPFDQWLEMLVRSGEGHSADSEVELVKRNPALKLLDFFLGAKAVPEYNEETMGLPTLSVVEAERVAPSLSPSHLPQLSAHDAKKWLAYWRSVKFL